LVTTLLIVVSVFLPIALLPPWLQLFVQAFPVYWVGLGVRSAMFPMEMVAAELGKWGTVELFAVPAVWSAIGLLLAPILLRRMAQRQSGSELARMRNRTRSKR
jgi:ABC-2 type transport system permease protein